MGVSNVASANPGLSRGALLGFALDTSTETPKVVRPFAWVHWSEEICCEVIGQFL